MRSSIESPVSQSFIRWALVSAAFAVLTGFVIHGLLWVLREPLLAAHSFDIFDSKGIVPISVGGPHLLIVLFCVGAGWASALLAERTWGYVGWPLYISVALSAIVAALVAWLLGWVVFSAPSSVINVAYLWSSAALAGAGAITVAWRSLQ